MKVALTSLLILSTILYAQSDNTIEKKELTKKHIEEQLKKEKKFSREQTFYKGDQYDLKGAEVDDSSVKKMKELPNYNEDFDMDNVYD